MNLIGSESTKATTQVQPFQTIINMSVIMFITPYFFFIKPRATRIGVKK